jgi:hypothetical protein
VLKRVEKVLKGKLGIEDSVGVKESKEYGVVYIGNHGRRNGNRENTVCECVCVCFL